MSNNISLTSAVFLVAGTCIGGGMLALPIATGVSGFVPSLIIMALCWFAMTATALLLLEASLWMKEGSHIITMTSAVLGPIGKAVSWILYLFICYASLVAYTAGGGAQIASSVNSYWEIGMPRNLGCLAFLLLFGSAAYLGSKYIGRINAILFGGMIAAYFGLVGMGVGEVNAAHFTHRHWNSSFIAIPMLLTAFSFQTIVPSLTPLLKRNVKALRIAIIGGTILAFIIYALWQWLILGIVPVEGPNGLASALAAGDQPATQFLKEHVSGKWIALVAEYFAFFAIATSFLGMTLGLFDFLADGLNIDKNCKKGKIALGVLIAMPTLAIALLFEKAFMAAMDASGGLGDSILNGIIPVLIVWRGRYYMNYPSAFRTPGGKGLLAGVMALFIGCLVIEILALLGLTSSVYQ